MLDTAVEYAAGRVQLAARGLLRDESATTVRARLALDSRVLQGLLAEL